LPEKGHIGRKPPKHPGAHGKKPHLMMRTRHPTLYWSGIPAPVFLKISSISFSTLSSALKLRGIEIPEV
jgi:hypothetical protein